MKIFLALLLYISFLFGFSSSLFCIETIGVPFTVSLPVQVPEQSIGSLKTYLNSIKAMRPLPGDYLLESYVVDPKKGLLTITGRFMKEGVHTLTLGTFEWGKDVILLPQVEVIVAPHRVKPLSASDMLLPFPQEAFKELNTNSVLRKSLFDGYLRSEELLLHKIKNVRKGFIGVLFFFIMTPFLVLLAERKIQVWKASSLVFSPEKELALVKKSNDWTRLLALLQKISGKKGELTSYELEKFFSQEGSQNLAQAARLIEHYGYVQKENLEKFEEAVVLSEKALL